MFEIAKTATGYASAPTTLVSFNGSDGGDPSSLIADAQGDLFGTTSGGGAIGDGTVFEIKNAGTALNPSNLTASAVCCCSTARMRPARLVFGRTTAPPDTN